ncbi:MAG: Hsp70 family protein, partial [Opitutales bacterium]
VEEEFIAEKDGTALHLNEEISREMFEALIHPLLDRTMDCLQRALDDAHLSPGQIDKVILVGGSTRTPLVTQLLEERLGQAPHQEVNPDLIVAMGAAIQAAIIAGQNVGAVLVDITPHSLGIKCLSQRLGFEFAFQFAPIIHRNTALPASRSEMFHTVYDRQSEVEIDVYQGESEDVRNNHRVGRFLIQGLAPLPAGNPLVVQLDLNLDGLLKVSARERATGLQKQVTIENALARYEREELDEAREHLSQLWEDLGEGGTAPEEETGHGEEMPALVPGPREGQREAVQARALLEKAERLMERVQPEDRSDVERLMARVRTAMTDRQWDRVTQASNELADTLFYLEA